MAKVMSTILNYLTQSSTYKGIFTILATFGIVVSEPIAQAICGACLGIFGLVDVLVDERKEDKE